MIVCLLFLVSACSNNSEQAYDQLDETPFDTDTSNEQSNDVSESVDYSEVSCDATYALPIVKAHSMNYSDSVLTAVFDKVKTNGSAWTSTDVQDAIVLELEEKSLVKELVISWRDPSLVHNFDISASIDGTEYESISTSNQSTKGYLVTDRIDFSNNAKTANFIQIRLNGSEVNSASGVIEIESFGCNQDVSHNIELIDWYLSVQSDEDGNGRSDNISEQALAAGYYDPRFFYTSADGGLVFTSTVDGFKTSTNTSYVRSELREMLRRGDSSHRTQGVNQNNWVFSSAPDSDLDSAGGVDGVLDVRVAVNSVTTTGDDSQLGRVIIGQIHANDDEPIRVYYRKLPNNANGSIYIAHEYLRGNDVYYELIGSRSNNASNPANGIPLNEKFDYQIKVVGNTLTFTVTKENGDVFIQDVDMTNSNYDEGGQYMYFKAGVYNQNNSGHRHDFVQATFYSITNSHTNYQY